MYKRKSVPVYSPPARRRLNSSSMSHNPLTNPSSSSDPDFGEISFLSAGQCQPSVGLENENRPTETHQTARSTSLGKRLRSHMSLTRSPSIRGSPSLAS